MNDPIYYGPYFYVPYEKEEYRKENKEENKDSNLFTLEEASMYGNLFKNEYVPYLNYKPTKPVRSTEKEIWLGSLDDVCNYIHDLDLYLAVYPQKVDLINLKMELKKKYDEIKEKYQKKYGPLSAMDSTNKNGYDSYVLTLSPWLN